MSDSLAQHYRNQLPAVQNGSHGHTGLPRFYSLPRTTMQLTSGSFLEALEVITITFVLCLQRSASLQNVNDRNPYTVEFSAINCRKHSALLTEFGGVGDGKTLNTKAFQAAVDTLGTRYAPVGGAQLIVPPGKWLTGSFNLSSHFTLFISKDAEILASQDEKDWPVLPPLPSYGVGRDAPAGRFSSLIFGTNLTDVTITGDNGTINGQGESWWVKFKQHKLKETRPYLIEIMFSKQVQISNLTLINSPSWNVHPVYSSDVLVQGLTIYAPVDSPNTDGINPDSCDNVRIQDCFVISGDDCVAIKSGWDEYGIRFNMPAKNLVIRKLTCISPDSAAIAVGSEMSGGVGNVRIEDVTAVGTQSAIRIKTAPGRGGYVVGVHARRMTMKTMKYVFWMTGSYGSHPDQMYDPGAFPVVREINYRDIEASNVTYSARLEGIEGHEFSGICVSNVTISLTKKPKRRQWNCTDISGISSRVTPPPCSLLRHKGFYDCDFPQDLLPIDILELQRCQATW